MSNPNVFRGVMDAGFAEAIADQHVQRDIIKVLALPIKRLRGLKPERRERRAEAEVSSERNGAG